MQNITDSTQQLCVKVSEGFEFIFFNQIVYIKADLKHTLVFAMDREKPIQSLECFSEIVNKLPGKPSFFVCKRSHVISQWHMKKYIKKQRRVITPKGEIIISKEHVKEFETLYCK